MPSETRVTCLSCGYVYHYDKSDQLTNLSKKLDNTARFIGGIGGSVHGGRKSEGTTNFNRCQKCGSRNVKVETVNY